MSSKRPAKASKARWRAGASIVGGIQFRRIEMSARRRDVAADGQQRPARSRVAVAIDGELAGELVLADELRAGTEALLGNLRRLGLERIVLATGDRREVAEAITAGLSIRRGAIGADAGPEGHGGAVGAQERAGDDGRRRRQ